jgi:hypothetical protein
MRSVYVVTTVPGARRRIAHQIAFLILARIVVTLAWLGHAIVQLVGAADAIVTARLGVPRLAVLGRRVRAALREAWEA